VFDSELQFRESALGLAAYHPQKLLLQPRQPGTPITDEEVEHVFCHELVHHILKIATVEECEPPLHKREAFVDLVAGLLHQAFTTAEYEGKVGKDGAA